jgi:N-acetylglucosamine-6-sulfatase
VKKILLLLSSIVFAVVLLSGAYSGGAPVAAQTSSVKPNIVFIIADDMRYSDLTYMPKTRRLLGAKGMRFKQAFVSYGMCCPSRATIMRGQYAHNHGVWFNENGPPESTGWEGYKYNGGEKDNVATRLRGAGYRTGLFGKYLNGYINTTYIPPGWTKWFATFDLQYFNYDVNNGGHITHYGSGKSDYQTDVLRRQTRKFIGTSVAKHKPFFAYVAPTAPHEPATPAPRDAHTYDGEKAPRLPSFNEKDTSDKPPWISNNARLGADQIAQIDALHENRAESLQAVDDLVEGVVNKLKIDGVAHTTYIFFTSDNGWQHGEHRILCCKRWPYEESIQVPLLVRGPNVSPGSTNKLTLNTDFLPTFTDLAGIQAPRYVDGRSLRPLLEGGATTWRTAILLEARRYQSEHTNLYGIRTSGSKYVEYEGGFRELYDLNTDPYELTNNYDAARPPTSLAARLQDLKVCAGATCRAAEDGP